MQSKDFTIGVLATTAAILLVGLILVQSNSAPALADGMTTSASNGNYILAVGSFTQADEDLVYVIDSATDRMVVYGFDTGRRQIQLLQGINLGELRQGATPGPAQPTTPSGQSPRRTSQPPAQPATPNQPQAPAPPPNPPPQKP